MGASQPVEQQAAGTPHRRAVAEGVVGSSRADRSPPGGRVVPPAPPPSSPAARKVMQANRSDSGPERALRSALHRRGLRFRKHLSPVKGLRCRPDIVFTRAHVAVFVDGCFWHRCPQHGTQPTSNAAWWKAKLDANVARDRRNDFALTEAGWAVVRCWEHEDIEEMADRVCMAVDERMRGDWLDGRS